MNQGSTFIQQLDNCPIGKIGSSKFEEICTEVLKFLFVPPLGEPTIQAPTLSRTKRRDAIFPNRNITATDNAAARNWHHLFLELNARMIVFEFKNYDKDDIGHDEVDQTRNYMTEEMGKLAIMICNKEPVKSAYTQRNSVYTKDKKIILFITKKQLKEMLEMKDRGEEPSDFIIDLVERFYIQHE